ncbi:hypothetical protein ACTMU2_12580 [Cupriavidus basilensis]
MKIRLACLAALSLLPVAAHAQANATRYGIADAGVEYTASAAATRHGQTLRHARIRCRPLGFALGAAMAVNLAPA